MTAGGGGGEEEVKFGVCLGPLSYFHDEGLDGALQGSHSWFIGPAFFAFCVVRPWCKTCIFQHFFCCSFTGKFTLWQFC